MAAGEFVVSKAKRLRLDAYLGTCAGVAIADQQARAGGLLHILLPETTSSDPKLGGAVCARSGSPLFVEAL